MPTLNITKFSEKGILEHFAEDDGHKISAHLLVDNCELVTIVNKV